VNAAVAEAERALGKIDILVNSAGVPGESLRTTDVTDEEWQKVFAINANGSFFMCRAVLRGMLERGLRPDRPGRVHRRQGGQPDGGGVLGEQGGGDRDDQGDREGRCRLGRPRQLHCAGRDRDADPRRPVAAPHRLHGRAHPARPDGKADEVAALACFLASEDLSFSTGATYDISGGRATF
jgi:3-oxoacyl-[acyl-carrier protein] reductase